MGTEGRILVILPTRGRPVRLMEAVTSFVKTSVFAELLILCDEDDSLFIRSKRIRACHAQTRNMVQIWHDAAESEVRNFQMIGLAADDVLWVTPGWDWEIYKQWQRNGPGVYWAHDNLRGKDLCNHPYVSSVIIRIAGASIPGQRHLFLDNYFYEIGKAMDRLFYMPEILISHEHFTKNPALMDEHYDRVNSEEMYRHDGALFRHWKNHELPKILPKLKTLLV